MNSVSAAQARQPMYLVNVPANVWSKSVTLCAPAGLCILEHGVCPSICRSVPPHSLPKLRVLVCVGKVSKVFALVSSRSVRLTLHLALLQ